MNINEIKELIDKVNASTIEYFEFNTGNGIIKMDKATTRVSGPVFTKEAASTAVKNTIETRIPAPSEVKGTQTVVKPLTDIKCKMVGSFRRSTRKKSPFVEVGSKVKKGDMLCIIEALRLDTEVKSEVEGTVMEIVAEENGLVDYGCVLFRIQE